MSKLSEDLLSREPTNWGCAIAALFTVLDEEDVASLKASLQRIATDTGRGRAKVYSSTWLANMLNKNGHTISRSTIERHIKGNCSCGKLI